MKIRFGERFWFLETHSSIYSEKHYFHYFKLVLMWKYWTKMKTFNLSLWIFCWFVWCLAEKLIFYWNWHRNNLWKLHHQQQNTKNKLPWYHKVANKNSLGYNTLVDELVWVFKILGCVTTVEFISFTQFWTFPVAVTVGDQEERFNQDVDKTRIAEDKKSMTFQYDVRKLLDVSKGKFQNDIAGRVPEKELMEKENTRT